MRDADDATGWIGEGGRCRHVVTLADDLDRHPAQKGIARKTFGAHQSDRGVSKPCSKAIGINDVLELKAFGREGAREMIDLGCGVHEGTVDAQHNVGRDDGMVGGDHACRWGVRRKPVLQCRARFGGDQIRLVDDH